VAGVVDVETVLGALAGIGVVDAESEGVSAAFGKGPPLDAPGETIIDKVGAGGACDGIAG
jgi:hypothetical protein